MHKIQFAKFSKQNNSLATKNKLGHYLIFKKMDSIWIYLLLFSVLFYCSKISYAQEESSGNSNQETKPSKSQKEEIVNENEEKTEMKENQIPELLEELIDRTSNEIALDYLRDKEDSRSDKNQQLKATEKRTFFSLTHNPRGK